MADRVTLDVIDRPVGDKTEYFLRLRPLVERGSLAGATPLAPVLSQPVPAP